METSPASSTAAEDEKIIVLLQAYCRGHLARKKIKRLQVKPALILLFRMDFITNITNTTTFRLLKWSRVQNYTTRWLVFQGLQPCMTRRITVLFLPEKWVELSRKLLKIPYLLTWYRWVFIRVIHLYLNATILKLSWDKRKLYPHVVSSSKKRVNV